MTPLYLVPQGAEYRTLVHSCRRSGLRVVGLPLGKRAGQFLAANPLQDSYPVVLWGLCGSLSQQLPIGTVVVCAECCTEGSALACDPVVTARLAAGLASPVVRCFTADRVVHRAAEKIALGKQYDCAVVDMEGYFVLEVLRSQGIGVGIVRVVSDGTDGDLPDLSPMIDADGNFSYGALAKTFGVNPRGVMGLIYGGLIGLRTLGTTAQRWTTQDRADFVQPQ